MRSCDLGFIGNAATLSTVSSKVAHISTNFVHEGGLSRGVAFTCLSPIKKLKQPHTSFPPAPSAPLLRPRSSARLFISQRLFHILAFSACLQLTIRLCFFARPRARSEPSRSRFVLTPSSVWFLRFVPALALSPCPSPVSHSRVFGSPESAFFPLLRLPRACFSALPLHIPSPCSTPAP